MCSTLLHGIAAVDDGHGSSMDLFVFQTHASLVSCNARGCGAIAYDVSMIAAFLCLGINSWLIPQQKPWPFSNFIGTHYRCIVLL